MNKYHDVDKEISEEIAREMYHFLVVDENDTLIYEVNTLDNAEKAKTILEQEYIRSGIEHVLTIKER